MVSLNPKQKEAVECEGSVVVLSGAGTGKTHIIIERIRRLLEHNVRPSEILALTYTSSTVAEIRSRLGNIAENMFVCTFHAFGMRIMSRHPEETGLGRSFSILDLDDQRQMVRLVLAKEMELPKENYGGFKPKAVQKFIISMKERGLRAENVLNHPDKLSVEAYFCYEIRCRSQSKADFEELLLCPREMLQNNPMIREYWSNRFKFILVDELENINQVQLEMLSLLRRKETVFLGVGDEDQSIYSFRGARQEMVARFSQEFVGNNIIRLGQNYRSTDNILRLANDILGQNYDHVGKNLQGNLGDGDLPVLTRHSSDDEEARTVAQEIADMRDRGEPLSDICILYKYHALSQLFETHLRNQGLRFRTYNEQRFQQYFARPEIKDAFAYLIAAVNPNDIEAVIRSVNKPARGFGKKFQERLVKAVRTGRAPQEIIEGSNQAGARDYSTVINRIRTHAENGDVTGAVYEAVYGSGLHDRLFKNRGQERADHLEELINITAKYENDSENPSLVDFIRLATIDYGKDIDDVKDEISLMTIHRAKGLSFKRVFLIGLEQMFIPGYDKDNDMIAEERRLLYVAVTRAQLELRMSHSAMRRHRGAMHRSFFTTLLQNINPELVRQVNGPSLRSPNLNPEPYSLREKPCTNQVSGKKSLSKFAVGDKVNSTKFGVGVVLAFDGEGDNEKVLVLFFRDKKRRWLVLKLAGLSLTARK